MHTPTITYISAYAIGLTAIGTIALAVATFVLARRTRKLAESGQDTADAARHELALLTKQTDAMVSQTQAVRDQTEAVARQLELLKEQAAATARQSDAAEAALSSAILPVLAAVPDGIPGPHSGISPDRRQQNGSAVLVDRQQNGAVLELPLRNVGPGLAKVINGFITHAQEQEAPKYPASILHGGIVAHDEIALFQFGPNETLQRWLDSQVILIADIAYTDVSGRQPSATQVILTRDERGDPRVLTADPFKSERWPGTPIEVPAYWVRPAREPG
jgi:hypothetical protein